MKLLNIEIKARCNNPGEVENILRNNNARFEGTDKQSDTYFNSKSGRLKLREGNIENSLIHYNRIEKKGQKKSEITLYKTGRDSSALKKILSDNLGVVAEVIKTRKIFFIENVKFHIDNVEGLGSFVEIEAIDEKGEFGEEILKAQCDKYIDLLNLRDSEFIDQSYCDMI